MPSNVVDNPEDEKKWKRAKKRAKEQYDDVESGSDEFYERVMGIYKNMNPDGIDKESSIDRLQQKLDKFSGPRNDLNKIARQNRIEKIGSQLKKVAAEAQTFEQKQEDQDKTYNGDFCYVIAPKENTPRFKEERSTAFRDEKTAQDKLEKINGRMHANGKPVPARVYKAQLPGDFGENTVKKGEHPVLVSEARIVS